MGVQKGSISRPTTQTQPEANNPLVGSVTSSFLVQLGGTDNPLVSGNLEGDYEDYAPLLWFTSTEERISSGTSTGEFKASATLVHSLLELHIPTDSYMPTVRQALRDNSNIDEVKIVRLGHTDGSANTELYSSTFDDCKLEAIEEFPDKLVLHVRISTRSDESTAIDVKGAEGAGNTASGWDYTTNSSTAD